MLFNGDFGIDLGYQFNVNRKWISKDPKFWEIQLGGSTAQLNKFFGLIS